MNSYTFKRVYDDDGTIDKIKMYQNGGLCKTRKANFNGYIITNYSIGYFINGLLHIYKKRIVDTINNKRATRYY